jgi:hypothetical protein
MDNIINNKQIYKDLVWNIVAIYEDETYYPVYELIEDILNSPFSFFISVDFMEDTETSNEYIEHKTEEVVKRIGTVSFT